MFSPKKISIAALSLLGLCVFTSTVMAKNAEPTTLDSVVQQAATEVMKAHDINGLRLPLATTATCSSTASVWPPKPPRQR